MRIARCRAHDRRRPEGGAQAGERRLRGRGIAPRRCEEIALFDGCRRHARDAHLHGAHRAVERPGIEQGAAPLEERGRAGDRRGGADLACHAARPLAVEREGEGHRCHGAPLGCERTDEAVERGPHHEEERLRRRDRGGEIVRDDVRIVGARQRRPPGIIAAREAPRTEPLRPPAALDVPRREGGKRPHGPEAERGEGGPQLIVHREEGERHRREVCGVTPGGEVEWRADGTGAPGGGTRRHGGVGDGDARVRMPGARQGEEQRGERPLAAEPIEALRTDPPEPRGVGHRGHLRTRGEEGRTRPRRLARERGLVPREHLERGAGGARLRECHPWAHAVTRGGRRGRAHPAAVDEGNRLRIPWRHHARRLGSRLGHRAGTPCALSVPGSGAARRVARGHGWGCPVLREPRRGDRESRDAHTGEA